MAASWLVANTRTFSRNLCQITAKSVHQPPSKLLVCKKSIPGRSIQGLHTRSLSCLSTRSVLRSSALRGDKRVGARTFRLTSAKCENVQTVSTPQFADSVSEGDINFLKAVGDAVAEDETVAEIETDKTALEVKAPAAGVIKELLVEDGSTVTQGMQLFKIAVGESGSAK